MYVKVCIYRCMYINMVQMSTTDTCMTDTYMHKDGHIFGYCNRR